VPLDTDGEAMAITKALRIRANPLLTGANPLAEEIKAYMAVKQEKGTYTRNSVDSRAPVLKMWAKARNLREVREISTDEIKLWLNSLRRRKQRLKESSIESYGMIIRVFCGWLVEENKLRENPTLFIKARISTSAKRRRFCLREQVDSLISKCADLELKFILYCGFHAGLRKGEIVQARPHWFDLRLNIVHITESETWKPKDKDKRTIPLTTTFKKFLEEEMSIDGELPSPFLIYSSKVQGKARYRYDFRKPFDEYAKAKGYAWLKPHVMRHTFASLLAIAGVSIFKIAQWLGDDVRVVERHYAHLLPQDSDIERAFGHDVPIRLRAKSRKPWSQQRNKQRENTCAESLFGTQPDRHGP
jgi:integrase